MVGAGYSFAEWLEKRFMHDRRASARILEIVSVVVRRQQRINHRDYRANPRRAKPTPNKFWTIRKNDEHTIFHPDAQHAQSIPNSIRHPRRLAIRPGFFVEVKTDFVFAPFL